MNSSLFKILGGFLSVIVIIVVIIFSVFNSFGKGGHSVNKEEVEKIVAEYLQSHPQEIIDSVTKHQQNAMEQENTRMQESVKNKLSELENDTTSPVVGNKNGDVTVIEFFDYNCGYCKKAYPSVIKLIEEDKDIKFVFKELPILGPNSELASRAALAVNMISPQKYFPFHKKLMETRITGQEVINSIAKELGIDVAAMETKMKSEELGKIISKDRDMATSIGIHGTPAFIVAGILVPGFIEHDALKALVTKARNDKKTKN